MFDLRDEVQLASTRNFPELCSSTDVGGEAEAHFYYRNRPMSRQRQSARVFAARQHQSPQQSVHL